MASERIPSPESPVHEGSTTQQLHMGGEGESRSFSGGASERKRNMPRAGQGPRAFRKRRAEPPQILWSRAWNSADPSTGTTGPVRAHAHAAILSEKSPCSADRMNSIELV